MELFENKKIRCLQVVNTNKWYFSVIDICAALRCTDYYTARNYWKWLKNKLVKVSSQPVSATNQLKLPCADGKLRYTDVMDVEEILRLIQQFPSQKAVAFRLWLLKQMRGGKNISKCLTGLLTNKEFAKEIKNAVVTALGSVVLLKTVSRRKIL